MNITLVAAIGSNNELGYNNKLIWHIPEDLAYFKTITMGKYIIMGYNTYLSLPKKLSGRKYIILTSKDIHIEDTLIFHNISTLLEFINNNDEEFIVIGGSSIYNQMIEYANKMILTQINDSKVSDVYFPKFNVDNWYVYELSKDSYQEISYKRLVYTKKD